MLGSARLASAAPCAQLCPPAANPCTISASLTCDSPAEFDLGGRDLAINAKLRVTGGDGGGFLKITGAGSVSMSGTGSIVATAGPEDGGQVIIEAADAVTLQPDSLVDVSADFGGFISFQSDGGDITTMGSLDASGSKAGGGGEVDLTTLVGNISIHGPIDIRGGDAGFMTVEAGGSIDSNAAGTINGPGTTPSGGGAILSFHATNDIALDGAIDATADGNVDDGEGEGGDITVTADTGGIEIGGKVDLTCTGPDGQAGTIEAMAAGDFTLAAPIVGAALGTGGAGGEVTTSAARSTIASTIDLRGNDEGGLISITSTDTLMVLGQSPDLTQVKLLADGTGPQAEGGQVQLQACTLQVLHGSLLSALGAATFEDDASNVLRASGPMTVNGTLTAGVANRLLYRETVPTIGPMASITPDPEITQDLTLPCCAGDECPPPPTTTTTTSPSTTTTSTTGTTPTTTTSSTTVIGPTTTTSTTVASTTVPTTTSTTNTTTTTTSPTTSTLVTTTTSATESTTSTSSTVVASTSTSVPSVPVTTSTLGPTSCRDEPLAGFDLVDCRLQLLSDELDTAPASALGGTKSARTLTTKINRASQLLGIARGKAKPAATLRKSKQQLKAFSTLVKRGMRRKHNQIDAGVAEDLLTLTSEATSMLDQLRTATHP